MQGEEFDVAALRKRLGWSRERLAQELKVSAQSVFRWEKGRSKPIRLAVERMRQLERELTQGGVRAA